VVVIATIFIVVIIDIVGAIGKWMKTTSLVEKN
jgi:hypothetical protein